MNETSLTYKASAAARRGSARLSRVTRRQLAAWAAAMALLGWGLMTIGALVRASESGLGCPDWPACHGQLVAGGHHALVEEFHRWVATVLVAVVGSRAWLSRFACVARPTRRRWPPRPGRGVPSLGRDGARRRCGRLGADGVPRLPPRARAYSATSNG